MIDEKRVKQYCCDDISLIENYDNAVNDYSQIWDCHHKLEIQGEFTNSIELLKKCGLYYQVPAWQLIFLTHSEHAILHNHFKKNMLGKNHSEEAKRKISEAKKCEKNPRAKAVSQYTKSGEFIKTFYSAREAARQTGIAQQSISACCHGKLKYAGGFLWRYI